MTTADGWIEKVEEIAPIIREHAEEAEKERRLSRPVVEAMLQAGFYRMSRPKAFGGLALDPITIFKVVEAVARHDSAAAWNLSLSVQVNWFLAWLPDKGASEVLGNESDTILGTSFTPIGQATPVEGGYRVSGQWPFISGSNHCQWFLLIPFVMDGDQPLLDEHGLPVRRFMWFPAEHVEILDTWHTLGMRGTGSHDVVVSDVFVPEERTAPVAPLDQPGSAFQDPLYRLSIWGPIALLAPPALGVARAAIDDLVAMLRTKTSGLTGGSIRDRQVVQRQVAEADATLRSARAFLYETFRDNWEAAVQGAEITLERKGQMQLATSHANVSAAKAVDLVHEAAGASAIRNQYRFQQYFRDAHTMSQHAASSASRYESVGALMLGVESDWPFFGI